MIICENSNIDIIQGVIGYGDVTEGITDWRIQNTSTGVFNILNSTSATARLSIIDNGNIGIRTTPSTSSSKLFINGFVFCLGIYKQNNRDIINDTSNYVLSTSNILVSRILTNTKNQWTSNNNMITPNLLPNIITSSPIATTTGTVVTDRYMSFTYTTDNVSGLVGQTQYTFSTTEPLICDILVIGGGGKGGAQASSGGGGAGTLLYHKNIYVNGNYTINVGRGCVGDEYTGYSSKFINNNGTQEYLAIGGGRGGYPVVISNGGQAYGTMNIYLPTDNKFNGTTVNVLNNDYVNTLTSPEGCRGNIGGERRIPPGLSSPTLSGGGGGAGGRGENGDTSYGGIGLAIDITGNSIVYAGGGTGGQSWFGNGVNIRFNPLYPTIESRGGGGYGSDTGGNGLESIGENGLNGTGGGGGGAVSGATGGNGGSGIVIIRYRKVPLIVGIGTTNPISKLHLYDDTVSETKLTIQNNFVYYISAATPTFTIGGPSTSGSITTTANSPDKFMIFTTADVFHTFTVPTGGIKCDILMIGGGGGGGRGYGNAGGAGACIVAINQTLPGGTCVVYVGSGGTDNINGNDSYITVGGADRYRAKGGGAAVTSYYTNGLDGGCGGGVYDPIYSAGQPVSTNVVTLPNGTTTTTGPIITSTYAVLGNAGGANNYSGGGGIGGAGGNSFGGPGKNDVIINGTTYNFQSYFANSGTFGVNGYIGGGGNYGPQLSLGGGGGMNAGLNGVSAIANTGGGGGARASGGSGIIIIRYRTTLLYSSPSIELIRGTQNDSNRDYKIANYNGDFIVKTSLNGIDNDYIKITGGTGAITNPTGTASWTTASDKRIKENIERASYDKCYESINKLELNRFNYIKGFNTVNRDITQLGFIAQEVKEIFPKSVFENSFTNDTINISDLHSIDITQINYSLYGAVKKLIEIINDDEEKIKRIESLLNIDIDKMLTSNLILDTVLTSNIDISSTSNIDIDITLTSNLILDIISSNIDISSTSNLILDTISSNIDISPISNIDIDKMLTSNIDIDKMLTSNIDIDSISIITE